MESISYAEETVMICVLDQLLIQTDLTTIFQTNIETEI